ncbi:MAG: hypothetical protein PCFJNLEI_00323 [Verrucomicrobiae bacterium]|nr:hypothetical protein [Verrucomicrobiae bacterium]
MSNTRRTKDRSGFNPERYMSSLALSQARALPGNLVAVRCSVLEEPKDRRLVYFLQALSHREGGLRRVAAELFAIFPDRIGTESMHRFGILPGKTYSEEQARKVLGDFDDVRARLDEPVALTVDEALKKCWDCVDNFAEFLESLCLDPEKEITPSERLGVYPCHVHYFRDLLGALFEYQRRKEADAQQRFVPTGISEKIFEELNYSQDQRCLVVIDGKSRIGKTTSVKAWCEARLGGVRYVPVPPTNDERSFFVAVARALGTADATTFKAAQIRDRVEKVLETGHIMLVFDEAHYLWPQYRGETLPFRINWILTALVNNGVPVALVTTPQFVRNQRRVEKSTEWESEQLKGRIGHWLTLPESPTDKDMGAVAKALLPEGNPADLGALVDYATASQRYFAGIDFVVRRARYLAEKRGAAVRSADLREALANGILPSDAAMREALASALPAKSKRSPRMKSAEAPSIHRRDLASVPLGQRSEPSAVVIS